MKTLFASIAASLAATQAFAFDPCDTPAFAAANPLTCGSVPVPEISALEGTAAIAALAAIVLIAWERRRRAA